MRRWWWYFSFIVKVCSTSVPFFHNAIAVMFLHKLLSVFEGSGATLMNKWPEFLMKHIKIMQQPACNPDLVPCWYLVVSLNKGKALWSNIHHRCWHYSSCTGVSKVATTKCFCHMLWKVHWTMEPNHPRESTSRFTYFAVPVVYNFFFYCDFVIGYRINKYSRPSTV